MPGEKRYLVIGINRYSHAYHTTLKNAEQDALRFAAILEDKYGFVPFRKPLLNEQATEDNIREALSDLANTSFEDDSVIVFFAGHGTQHSVSKVGYWVPYDATDKVRTYLDHTTVLNDLKAVKAKHILLISDSCFSGTFISQTRSSGMVPTPDELDAKASRWVFASGDEQKVSDGIEGMGSPFGKSLCGFLQDNTKPVVPAYELFDSVTRLTRELTKDTTRQEPQAERMRFDDEGGQMVFRLLPDETAAAEAYVTGISIEFPLPENPALAFYMPRSLSAAKNDTENPDRFFDIHLERSYLDDLMETQRRLVVLGTAGMGKSIELLNRANKWRDGAEDRKSIFVRFNTYTGEDIATMLPDGWEKIAPGDLYIFMDGLDEIQPVNFHTAVRKLSDFQSRNPLTGILVSCRTNFYDLPTPGFSGTLPDFEVYHLNDISYPEIVTHAAEKYSVDGTAFSDNVDKHLFSDLVQKPFFLRVLLEHYRRSGDLDISRSSIMEAALLEGYTGNKEHFYSAGTAMSKTQTFQVLEKIAFVMEVMGKNYLTDEQLAELFPGQQDYDKLKFLPAFSRDDIKDQWFFDHNNIQEYLASRVLAKRSLEDLIDLISSEIGGERKLKPHWINTLSFLVSTGEPKLVDPLLAWLAANDREVLVRFESDRIDPSQREALFRLIYDHYRETGIWLRSNKFTDRDLASFGDSVESIQYLVDQLTSGIGGRNNMLNAMGVLRHFRLDDYPEERLKVKSALLALFDLPEIDVQDIYSVMNTLYRLKLNDDATISGLIERYGKRKNQYIRAGLYNIIGHSENPDQFVQVYLDGLDLGEMEGQDNDRSGTSLMDESMALTRGLSGLTSPGALITLFDKFSSDKFHSYLFQRDYIDIMEKLMNAAINAYPADHGVYDAVLRFFLKESTHHNSTVTTHIIRFFDETKTRYKALYDTWNNAKLREYEKGLALSPLINRDSLVELSNDLASSGDKEKLAELHGLLVWDGRTESEREEFLIVVEQIAMKRLGLELLRPVQRDWAAVQKERSQAGFNMLFDPDALQAEVNRVFDELNKDELNKEDIYNYDLPVDERPDSRFNPSALLVIRDLIHTWESVNREDANDWFLRTEESLAFRAGHIHSKLSNSNQLDVNEEQITFIKNWTETHPENYRKTWFFLKRFNLKLPEKQILDLTAKVNYSQESKLRVAGHIEQLEPFIEKDKIVLRVLENLKDEKLEIPAWIMNAGYALRHNLKTGYPDIADYIQLHGDQDYSLDEVLMYWFEKSNGLSRLKKLVKEVSTSYTRWRGIRILEEAGGQEAFLKEILTGMMQNVNEKLDDRIYAANHLLNQDDISGLEFLSDRILNHPETYFDYRLNLGSMGNLRSVKAIPILLELLLFAKRPEFKADPFNDLESPVISGLFGIGTQSPENFLTVKAALTEFVKTNSGTLPNVQYLHVTLANIEQELRKRQSTDISIGDAKEEYKRFTVS